MSNSNRMNRSPVKLDKNLLEGLDQVPSPANQGVAGLWMPDPAPQLPPSLKDAEFKALIAKCPNLTPAASVRLPKSFWEAHKIARNRDPDRVLLTLVNSYRTFRMHRSGLVFLQHAVTEQADWKEGQAPTEDPFFALVADYVATHIAASGTEAGLFSRLVEGLSAPRPKEWHLASKLVDAATVTNTLRARFRLDPNKVLELKSDDILEASVDINLDSSAGLPYVGSKRANIKSIIEHANQFLRAAAGGVASARNFLVSNPHFAVAKIMNKAEVYARAELVKKTRAIYVFSAPVQICFSAVFQRIQNSLPTVLESPDSRSGYGLSFSHGGADRFIRWLFWLEEPAPADGSVRYAVFGDDTYMSYVCGGKVFVMSVDVKQLDAHLTAALSGAVKAIFHPQLEPVLSSTWRAIAQLAYVMLFQHPVLLKNASTFNKRSGVSSGGPGTTIVDSIAVTSVWEAAVVPALSKWKPNTAEQLEKALHKIADFVKERWGLVLKPETLKAEVVGEVREEGGARKVHLTVDSISARFLGAAFSLYRYSVAEPPCWVPRYDQVKLAGAYVYPRESYDGEAAKHELLQRTAGYALLCSGQQGAILHRALSLEFQNLKRMQARWPKGGSSMAFAEEDMSVGRDVYQAVNHDGPNWSELPSMEYFMSYWLPRDIGSAIRLRSSVAEASPAAPSEEVDLWSTLEEKQELADRLDHRARAGQRVESKHQEPSSEDDLELAFELPVQQSANPPPNRLAKAVLTLADTQAKKAARIKKLKEELANAEKASWADETEVEEAEADDLPPLPQKAEVVELTQVAKGVSSKHLGKMAPDDQKRAAKANRRQERSMERAPRAKKGSKNQGGAAAEPSDDELEPEDDLLEQVIEEEEAQEDEAQKRKSNTATRRAARRAQENWDDL